ncbi:response regulator transcription factor [Pseudonocardia xinjiangensis]|uniref:Response regulator transcription factor n=1 Tax=Pseudonocardia xinjiangensis TaxID=75289 RepID=A0ABX1RC83_9PSEU|nr:response regulator transcription factor [Pseudonocardia xinjiangensis]NMH77988.1 response regulator transcription factor [Pseudonocardia xinjiangensis]
MTDQPLALVVDDDVTVRDVVTRYLDRAGYRIEVAGDGEQALRAVAGRVPDVVILDLMLPRLGGLEVCRRLRRERTDLPIVMLTALGEEEDRVLGLELGADDYVTKPFSPRELVLRVASVLRRSRELPGREGGNALVVDGDLSVDVAGRRASLGERPLALTVREFDLLAFLVRRPGQVFTRAELLEQVWGWNFGDQSTVTVHVRRLREKIETDPTKPTRIATVWGVGYRYDGNTPA